MQRHYTTDSCTIFRNDALALSFNVFILALFLSSYYFDIEKQYGNETKSFFYIINIIWLIVTGIPFAFSHGTFSSEAIARAAALEFDPNDCWMRCKEFFRTYFGFPGVALHQTVIGTALRNLFEEVFDASYAVATTAAVILGLMAVPLICSFLCYKMEREQAAEHPRREYHPTDTNTCKDTVQRTYWRCLALLPKSNTARLIASFLSTLSFTVGVGALYIITLFKSPIILEARKTPIRLGNTPAESFAYIAIILWNIIAVVCLTTSFLNIATVFFGYQPTARFDALVKSIKRKTAWSTITSLTSVGVLSIFALLRRTTSDDSKAAYALCMIAAMVVGAPSTAFMWAVFYNNPVTPRAQAAMARASGAGLARIKVAPVTPIRINTGQDQTGTPSDAKTPEERLIDTGSGPVGTPPESTTPPEVKTPPEGSPLGHAASSPSPNFYYHSKLQNHQHI